MNKKIILLIILSACLLGYMVLTNPADIPLGLLLVPFLLILFVVFILANLLIGLLRGNNKKTTFYAAVLAIIIVNFLILRSVGQFTFQDGLISIAITGILAFYISKFKIKH